MIVVGVPGDFASFLTTCAAPGATEPVPVTNPNTNAIGVELGENDALHCTFYVIGVDAQGEPEPTAPVAQPTKEPVKALPNTGTGVTAGAEVDEGDDGNLATILALALIGGAAAAGLVVTRRRAVRP